MSSSISVGILRNFLKALDPPSEALPSASHQSRILCAALSIPLSMRLFLVNLSMPFAADDDGCDGLCVGQDDHDQASEQWPSSTSNGFFQDNP